MEKIEAHEITHAFDDSGINYNSEGMSAQLYDNKTVEAFHKEATCLRDQYSKYSIADSQVDGNSTLGENLADHGGLSMALEAYNQWRSKNKDHRLPALPFDDMQLFFIGYALPWCSRHTDKHTKNQVINDEHAPVWFWVLGPLSNSQAFSDTFQCPIGSRMNPKDKCTVVAIDSLIDKLVVVSSQDIFLEIYLFLKTESFCHGWMNFYLSLTSFLY